MKAFVSRIVLPACAATTLLAGCATPYSEAPIATNMPTFSQYKIQAAGQWNVIAKDLANTIEGKLRNGTACAAAPDPCTAIYVKEPVPKTEFGRAFQNTFISALVNQGANISTVPGTPVEAVIDIQAVKFDAERPQYRDFGAATLLVSGVWAVREIGAGAVGAGAVAAAAGLDATKWARSEFASGPTPKSEIIITISFVRSGQFIARTSNVYYVADEDLALYQYKPVATRNFEVVGDCGDRKLCK